MKSRDKYRSIGVVFCSALLAGCVNPSHHCVNIPSHQSSAGIAEVPSGLDAQYAKLRVRIVDHNTAIPLSAWMMNSEHLFIEDDSLLADVVRFSREKGGVDFLFSKVLDQKTSNEDLLAVSEILVWFGAHLEPGDENIHTAKASDVLKALREGRGASADVRFHAPVTEKIRDAAHKAQT